MSVVKSCCMSDDVSLRSVSVETLAPLLLRVWCVLDSTTCPLEGRQQFESTSESRRHQEDLVEFLVDTFKNIALGVKGESLGMEIGHQLVDNSLSSEACLAAIGTILHTYNMKCNAALRSVGDYATALLGQLPESSTASGGTESININAANSSLRKAHLDRLEASSVSNLLQHLLPTLLKDPYLLFYRATCTYIKVLLIFSVFICKKLGSLIDYILLYSILVARGHFP